LEALESSKKVEKTTQTSLRVSMLNPESMPQST